MIRPILVPLDGSEESESALEYVKVIAPKLQAGVELMRCFESPATFYGLPQLSRLGEAVLSEHQIQQMVQEYLDLKAAELAPLSVKTHADCGDAADGILKRAEEAQMVLISRHGRGARRWLLGGVTARVVRLAKCPVLVVPGLSSTPPSRLVKINTVMVCLDGSEVSERALERAVEIARNNDGKLILYRFVPIIFDADVMNLNLDEAKTSIARLAEQHKDLVKDTLVRRTEGRNDIVECAGELEADLIVMGSHGHRGVVRLLLGSVAEDVIHHADRPVLVVH